MTIHITPEPEFSYVSFESNIPLTSYLGVIQRVLDTFMPGKFILTIFANRVSFIILFHFRTRIGPKSPGLKKIFKISISRLLWQLNLTKSFKKLVVLETGLAKIFSIANFRIMNWPMLTLSAFHLERGGHLG